MEGLDGKVKSLKQRFQEKSKATNNDLRNLHADIELLKLDLAEAGIEEKPDLIKELSDMQDELQLKRLRHASSILSIVDQAFRLIAVWLCLVTVTFVIVFPCLLVSIVENILLFYNGKRYQYSAVGKVWIGKLVMLIAGISPIITYETSQEQTFSEASIICFSHGSTMDAFIVAASVPYKNYSLVKDDLFFIPFFNLMLLTFSAIPIIRSNLNKAKQSLDYVAQCLGPSEYITVAPEGTRSKSGQLLDFKKGPFYMWEHLHVPIIPMVIFGANELFPPGHQMSVPGRVYVRILKPIACSEASSREAMSALVRRRMLAAIKQCPDDASAPLQPGEIYKHRFALLALLTVDYLLYRFFKTLFIDFLHLTWWRVLRHSGEAIGVTVPGVYAFCVYILPFFVSLGVAADGGRKGKSVTKTD